MNERKSLRVIFKIKYIYPEELNMIFLMLKLNHLF